VRSVTEEQQRQPAASAQPFGLPFFGVGAVLLVGHRSLRISSLLAPCPHPKSQATPPFPIYEMGSKRKLHLIDGVFTPVKRKKQKPVRLTPQGFNLAVPARPHRSRKFSEKPIEQSRQGFSSKSVDCSVRWLA
jgi:hypothetical protein